MILEKYGPFDLLTRLTGAKGVVYIGQDSRLIQQLQSCFGETGCTIIQESVAPPKPPAQDDKPGSLTGTVFSDSISVVPYYEASLPTYSGLIRPEDLQDYWQNLKTVKELEVETITLDTYFANTDGNPPPSQTINWLFVDSLPGGRILGGGADFLSSLDGLVVRAIRREDPCDSLKDSSLNFTIKSLTEAGFTLAHVEASRQPDICYGVFVRDWKSACNAQIDALNLAAKTHLGNYEAELHKRKKDIKTLDLARKTLSAKLDDTLASIETKNYQISDLTAKLKSANEAEKALEAEVASLKADTDAKTKQALKLNEEFKALQKENENLNTISSDFESTMAKLAQAEATISQLEKHKEAKQLQEQEKLDAVEKERSSQSAQLEQAHQDVETAGQRQMLAENNLDDLRAQYKEMAKTCDDQAKRFARIQAELRAALELINTDPTAKSKLS